MSQQVLFDLPEAPKKTYRAIRHDVVRQRQRKNIASTNHITEKTRQVERVLAGKSNLKILELFAGDGFLTKALQPFGEVTSLDKRHGTGDSFLEYHRYIADRRKFDVIDADPYGFPSRLLPDIFLLIDDGIFFVTVPSSSVNIPNGLVKTHLQSYYGEEQPSIDAVSQKIAEYGLCHWRQVVEIDCIKIGRMWRVVYEVKRVSATEYAGVRNR